MSIEAIASTPFEQKTGSAAPYLICQRMKWATIVGQVQLYEKDKCLRYAGQLAGYPCLPSRSLASLAGRQARHLPSPFIYNELPQHHYRNMFLCTKTIAMR
jgi:hypothetical protein